MGDTFMDTIDRTMRRWVDGAIAEQYAALEELLRLAVRDRRSVVVWRGTLGAIDEARVTPFETPTPQLYYVPTSCLLLYRDPFGPVRTHLAVVRPWAVEGVL